MEANASKVGKYSDGRTERDTIAKGEEANKKCRANRDQATERSANETVPVCYWRARYLTMHLKPEPTKGLPKCQLKHDRQHYENGLTG